MKNKRQLPLLLLLLFFSVLLPGLRAQSRPTIIKDFVEITSFDELVRPYRGKVVFIDLWATWCGPCRREFEYAPQLGQFARANDVVLLYIATDKGQVYPNWAEMIEHYGLNGYHLIARGKLREELFERFFDREEMGLKIMSVPHYVILDRDGRVAVRDARPPSSGQKLFKELKRFL